MIRKLIDFKQDDDGAVTVDWVVLTAGICFISIGIIAAIQTATTDASTGIGAAITQNGVDQLGEE